MANVNKVMNSGDGARRITDGTIDHIGDGERGRDAMAGSITGRRMGCSRLFALSAALVFNVALAQPTGNPKGSVAPTERGAEKPQAGRVAPDGATGSGKLSSESGPASARTQRTEPPGGGTAGGLTRRNPAGGPQRSDKGSATARPLPPSSQ